MGALKALIRFVGKVAGKSGQSIEGVNVQSLWADEDLFTFATGSERHPHTVLSMAASIKALLLDLVDPEAGIVQIRADIDDIDGRVIALETVETITPVVYNTSITLDWNALATRTVRIVLPLDFDTTTITSMNVADGLTYTVILDHAAGGMSGDNVVFDPAVFKFNGLLASAINGDPGYVYVHKFTGYNGKLLQTACFANEAL